MTQGLALDDATLPSMPSWREWQRRLPSVGDDDLALTFHRIKGRGPGERAALRKPGKALCDAALLLLWRETGARRNEEPVGAFQEHSNLLPVAVSDLERFVAYTPDVQVDPELERVASLRTVWARDEDFQEDLIRYLFRPATAVAPLRSVLEAALRRNVFAHEKTVIGLSVEIEAVVSRAINVMTADPLTHIIRAVARSHPRHEEIHRLMELILSESASLWDDFILELARRYDLVGLYRDSPQFREMEFREFDATLGDHDPDTEYCQYLVEEPPPGGTLTLLIEAALAISETPFTRFSTEPFVADMIRGTVGGLIRSDPYPPF